MIKLYRYVPVALCLAIQLLQVSVGQGAEQTSIRERILTAWKERRDQLKSFQCTCALIRTDMIPFGGAGDLFGEEAPGKKGPVELNSTFTFSMRGDKLAVTSKGEEWNHARQSRIQQSYLRSFDGVGNKAIIVGEVLDYPTAMIDDERRAAAELTANTHYIPLWLSFSPDRILTQLKFEIARMTVVDERAIHDGKECIEVTIPRGTLRCGVYLDALQGYVPVRYVEWRAADTMRCEIDVKYEADDAIAWAVSSWTSNLFDEQEKLQTSLSGEVEKIVINEPVSDDVFDIEIPADTHIRETLNGKTKYYIQEADGTRREIRRER